MSGNVFPAVTPPVVAGLPNWFARASRTAESGFNNDTICFWGDSTTATCLNWFGACPQPVTLNTFGAARFVNLHQKTGGALAGTRLLNFGNTGATALALLQNSTAALFPINRVLTANQQIYWPATAPPAAGDTVTIGTTVWTFIANGSTPSGTQVALGATFAASIDALVAALTGSTDAQTAQNTYAKRASLYDTSFALDVWSKRVGPAGAGQAIACSTAGATVAGNPVLQLPGLIVLCLGINDVRTGQTTLAQLVARLTSCVTQIRATVPTTDIVLMGPNSFTSDDVNGNGLVTPNGSAQAYSTILYGAYAALKNVWPNVVVIQKQDLFGKTCLTQAASGGSGPSWMADQLHPSLGAQTQMADWIAGIVGFQQPFNQQRANMARTALSTAPWTIYPREVEDPGFYDVVAQGNWLGQGTASGQDYLDFLFPGARYKEILPGDIVQMGAGGPVWQIPFTAALNTLNTTTTRILNLGTGLLPVISGGPVTVYRPKFEWDATVQSYRQQVNAYPYARRFYCPAAGANFLRLYPLAQNSRDPANMLLNAATDVIVPPGGFGAITGFSTVAFTSVGAWQVNKSGVDFSALAGRYVWVFSTFPQREALENGFEPIRLTLVGAIAGTTYVKQIATRGAGKVNKVYYTQGTAGTTDLTITLKIAGTLVLTLLITANHLAIQTTTWASGSSFSVYPGQAIEWGLSGGSGAADIAVALDIAAA